MVCEFYFDQPFYVRVTSERWMKGDRMGCTLDDRSIRSRSLPGCLRCVPHARSLLQASPDLYKQAHTALLKAFDGHIDCNLELDFGEYCTVNHYLEKLFTYPLPISQIKHITLEVCNYTYCGPEPLESELGTWKKFVELVGQIQLFRLELITIELGIHFDRGPLRNKDDAELFLRGGMDDALVAYMQSYLPKMEIGDPEKIERADGYVVPVVMTGRSFLSFPRPPPHRHTWSYTVVSSNCLLVLYNRMHSVPSQLIILGTHCRRKNDKSSRNYHHSTRSLRIGSR